MKERPKLFVALCLMVAVSPVGISLPSVVQAQTGEMEAAQARHPAKPSRTLPVIAPESNAECKQLSAYTARMEKVLERQEQLQARFEKRLEQWERQQEQSQRRVDKSAK